ncbi:hypothetical protein MYCTH_2124742 [Thermothelomyces thermophilus ATCC 42464]|uniref:Uncharacterized protein n=1 Tax=Thermothelomyces thermophilus (strain ATCC 42464 / BCRC 31852 / DSM 1799) TaxID=573729 RepID=G2QA43_THET4|nr:uncharacterized protein MYCTH_2124742 [Thermothelomyces thermophilus ATCC 42464]AEO55791.1 hypothetical protein MYCTH_2124742 [Thermothelomyces thermophilus ATCC 42464]
MQVPGGSADDGLRTTLQQSGKMVQNEYDRHFANLGPRFAQGDLVAQTQIQSQISFFSKAASSNSSRKPSLPAGCPTSTVSTISPSLQVTEASEHFRVLLTISTPVGIGADTATTKRPCQEDLVHSLAPGGLNDLRLKLITRGLNRTHRATATPVPYIAANIPKKRNMLLEGHWTALLPPSTRRRFARHVVRHLAGEREKVVVGLGGDGESEAIMVRTFLLTRRFIFKCPRERPGIAEYEGDSDIRELNQTLPFW